MYRKLKVITFIILILIGQNSLGQLRIEGVLLDKETYEPISFATVGIASLSIGTITNDDGSFALKLSDTLGNEILTFAMVGYQPMSISVGDFIPSEYRTVYLEQKATELGEVIITDDHLSRPKRKMLGNTQFNTGTMRLDENQNGGAMALLISHDEFPYNIYGARLWITYNSLPSFKVRIRIMDVDPNTGMPGNDLLDESIIVESDIKKGWLEFSLMRNNVWIAQKDFFLVYEWIMDASDRKLLLEQITSHLTESPDALSADSVSVGEALVHEQVIRDFKGGVWFGTLLHPGLGREFKCYYRLNSLDNWMPSAAKLTAAITLFQ